MAGLPSEQAAIADESKKESSPPDSSDAGAEPSAVLPPPDGGLKAWTQVFMGHLVLINGWGYLSSFGLFQSYYTKSLSATPSSISWIGSVQIFLVYLVGAVSGRALDAGYFHLTLGLGCFLQVLGVFMSSVSTEYWQLFLAQGICKGLGDGLVFCPTVSLVATYFSRRRSLAMAFTASGGATGGIIFPVIAQQLLLKIGFGWTVRVMGFVILFNSIVVMAIARVRLPPRKAGPLAEWEAFKELPYILFCFAMFFNMWAVYFAYFYVSSFAKSAIHVSESESLTLLLVMNAVGVPGRLVCGLVADRLFGPVNTLIPVAFFAAVLFYCWAAVSSRSGLYAFSLIYGFFGAGIQSLFPASCASLTADVKKMGARTGMCFTFVSVACLTGPPIAGALIQREAGGFLYAQMFGGSALMGGALTLVAASAAKGSCGTSFLIPSDNDDDNDDDKTRSDDGFPSLSEFVASNALGALVIPGSSSGVEASHDDSPHQVNIDVSGKGDGAVESLPKTQGMSVNTAIVISEDEDKDKDEDEDGV